MNHDVTEQDLRAPEFRDGSPADYERRGDGKIVRKDRFKRGMQDIAAIVFGASYDYEIRDVVAGVHKLKGIVLRDAIANARDVYEGDAKAQEVLDYVQAVLDNPREAV